ncbi:right-handed parallel beta-helix repeat-containing protein [Methanobrevibacter sp.]|uniref:right-handed parallel beta-helix repeat-containing protein n=1 Tax=Methanobrevibacter sp. TaxID=66852 RepID=UPI0025F128EA|nr:right-handed parallel beta-helix repeat-containing protein [Methanobrevibacter sp.]MBQ2831560.1 right-handed parallel beta-helix repeat-containing protein [Methanobrevibacter sp.]
MKGKLTIVCLLLFILCSISTVCAENTNGTQIMQENDALDNLGVSEDTILADASDDLQNIVNSASEGSTVTLNKSYAPANRITIDKSLTINGNGNTIDCSKSFFKSSSGDITLKNLKFANGNSANGAAIYITGSAKYTIINCTFTNNQGKNFGGAIYNNVVDTLTITGCRFTGNKVEAYGGAIYSKGNVVVENSVFENNYGSIMGGAIYCEKSVDISNSIFNSNKVDSRGQTMGGAIKAKKDSYITNSTFRENTANHGGALYSSSDLIIQNSQFIKNSAYEGGAIHVDNDNHIYIENSTFKQNSAEWDGGAIYSNKWMHVGNSIFELNTAKKKGGAIQTDYIQFSGKNTFTNNSANNHGGAIYTETIGTTNSNLIFNANHADSDFGGAIYINKKSGDVKFYSSVFTNNHANAGDGGAVYSDSSSTNLEFYNCTFTSNYATGGKEKRYGGAVRSCGSVKADNCTFTDNWAENYGGAIYTNTLSEIKNSVFISNQVKNGGTRQGGAIYVNNECTMTLSGNYFERNGGGSHGGVLYTDSKKAHLKLTNNAFIENSASEQGVSVFNSGYYDDVSNNWWGINGASIQNQLKEYHTVGSNDDKNDSKPLVVSIVVDKNVYSGVETKIKVSFTGAVTYYVLNTLKVSPNRNGTFITKKINSDSLDLIYVPDETGIHKFNFTINSQKLSCDMNVTYISVYGYDLTKTYGDEQLYSTVFKDKDGKYLPKGTKVTFNVNNTNYVREIADNYGAAILNANLDPGQYTVKAINNVTGESFTNKITVNKRNLLFDINEPYIIKLNASANKTVTFKVGSKTFTGTTSEEGYAYFLLNVTAGNHTVETIYDGKTIKDYITVSNKYAIIDLGLTGTSYGAMLPVYSNETFKAVSNTTCYSVIGENTYRYIMTSGDAFILYNVTVSNSQELTNVLRKMARKDYKVDVTIINLKKNTYKISDHFWEDSDWKYLVHLNHGTLIINGGGSTLEDDYKHNFASLDSNTNIMVNNLEFKKFYRVFASNGEVYCENSTFTQNDAQKWATPTKGSVIYNKNKATFKNCIFNGNENGGNAEHNRGGVLYADSNSLTNFISCSFKTKTDTVRAVEKSMVVVYDTSWEAYNHIKYNGYIDNNASLSIRNVYTLTHNMTKNLYVTNMTGLQDATEWIDSFNNITSFNITLDKGEYVITANDLKKYRDSQDWRSRTVEGAVGVVHPRSFIDVNSKPVVINGNGATIKMTGNDVNDDYHFAYIPKYGSLTLINLTLSGFNTAIENYGTFIAINCTFTDNVNHHIIKDGDYGGAIRNYGTVLCSDCIFKNNGANQGGAYYGFGISSNALFSNCQFIGNVIKSNLVWKNNNRNDLDIQNLAVVKLVNSKGYSSSTINTEKGGMYVVRKSLNDTVYNIVVDNLASLMKASKIVNGNTKYDIINITFVKGEYGVIPNSQSLFKADYGLLLINGEGSKVFVQNPHDDDTTQFLTVASRGNVRINGLTIEGFNIAIENSGKLQVINSIFNKNKADYKFKADYGGAIVNKGMLTVSNSTFTNNYAKYGGAIYTSGNAVILMSTFSANWGYHASKNVDIYNKDGCVDDIIISGPDHSYIEQHPLASWKMDLIESGVLIATMIITANVGYGLAVAGVPAAGLLATLASVGIGGGLGTILGAVYTSEYQNPSLFWNGVLKGISNGLKVASFGGAAYSIPFKIATKFMVAGVNHVISKGLNAAVKISNTVLNYYQKESKIVYFT